MTTKLSLLGAHVSIAKGFDHAIVRGEKIDANCIQIFTKSNRQWKSKKITDMAILKFKEQQKNSSVKIVIAHASYLINLGSQSKLVAQKSLEALIDELQRCELLGIPILVLHPGTMQKQDEHKSLQQIAAQINIALQQAKTKHVVLALETMAGQGSTAGSTFQQLATIISHVKQKKHIGVCVDTCHIFASGYTFDTPTTYKKLWKNFDDTIGLNKIKVIHINDSKKACGSRIDRHENIGHGKIKTEAFKLLMRDKKFKNVAKIIETPKGTDELSNNMKNLKVLKQYMQK